MDYSFTDEQKLIQKAVREFGANEIAPNLMKINEENRISTGIIKGLADLNVLGLTVSEEYGGLNADPVTAGIVAEELARADISCAVPTFYLVQAAWGHVLNKYGKEEAKQAILPKMTVGDAFLGIAATESDTGSDLGNMRTHAKKSNDGYILNGEKMFISGIVEAMTQLPDGGGYVTLVRTAPEKGTRGMSLFYVPVKDVEGISYTTLEDWGRTGISTGGFSLIDVQLPESHLIGEENKGFYMAMEGFDYARALISVVCAGAAMSALEHAMEYLKLRTAFGHQIGRFEGVQFPLSDNWARLEALRLMGYKALWLYGRELKGECTRFDVTMACAEAKLLGPQTAFNAINDAIQWFGAFGYTTECPLNLALRAVRSYYWAEGTLEIMKIIVARELLGKEYVAFR